MQTKDDLPQKIKILDSEYATFRRDILKYFICTVLKKPGVIIDPMSGTAPLIPFVETNGFTAYFNDLMPVHYYINQAKTRKAFEAYKAKGKDWFFNELLDLMSRLRGKRLHLSSDWINGEVLNTLTEAWQHTEKYDQETKYIFKAIILLSVRSFSSYSQSRNPTWFKPGGISEDSDTDDIIIRNISKFEKYFNTHYSQNTFKEHGISVFSVGPAASHTFPHQADYIITSPPYCNRLDLKRQFGPEMYFLSKVGHVIMTDDIIGTTIVRDYSSLSSDLDFLASRSEHAKLFFNRIKKLNEHGADYYLKYYTRFFIKMVNSITSSLNYLSPNGKAYVVTQDNIHRGFLIEMDTILRQVLKSDGWSLRIIKRFERHHLGLQNVSRKHAFVRPKHFEKVLVIWR